MKLHSFDSRKNHVTAAAGFFAVVNKCFWVREPEIHHAGFGNAVYAPFRHRRGLNVENPGDGCCAAESINNFRIWVFFVFHKRES